MALDHISIGWVWLNNTLNRIIDTINAQKVIGSTTVAVEESPGGTLLKAMPSGGTSGPGSAPPSGGQWCSLAVVDTSSGTCVTKYLWYRGTPASTSLGPPPS